MTVGLSLFQGDRNVQFGQQAAAGLLGIAPVYVLALAARRTLSGRRHDHGCDRAERVDLKEESKRDSADTPLSTT